MPTDAQIRQSRVLLEMLRRKRLRSTKGSGPRPTGPRPTGTHTAGPRGSSAPVGTHTPGPGPRGTPTPEVPQVIQPFMTAEDLMQLAEARARLTGTITDLDYDLQNYAADSIYEKEGINRAHRASTASANDEYAGRGLFHSSIRDAELFDIDATAAIRKNYLDRELDTLSLETQRRKTEANNAFTDFQLGMNQKMVENARAAAEKMGLPAPGTPAPDPAPTPGTPATHTATTNQHAAAGQQPYKSSPSRTAPSPYKSTVNRG